MKKKLKTMKDLDEESGGDYDTDDIYDAIYDWIEMLEDDKEITKASFDDNHPISKYIRTIYTSGRDCGETTKEVVNWIKHFFNLEEE